MITAKQGADDIQPLPALVYTVPEVAILLKLSEWSVYKLIRNNKIPGVRKFNGQYRVFKAILNPWMAAGASDELSA